MKLKKYIASGLIGISAVSGAIFINWRIDENKLL
jgi:hypothetical protein